MGREHQPETVWRAQELYCVDRRTFAETAAEVGVAASTLKRWSAKYDWQGKRDEIAKAEAEIRANTVLARAGMLKQLIDTKDAQVGFAVASLEKLAMDQAKAARAGELVQAQLDAPRRKIKTRADAVEAMREAVEIKLATMLSDPGSVNFRTLADLRKGLDLLAEMKPRDGKKDNDQLSPETVKRIEEMYGL